MANPASNSTPKPRPARVPSQRAQGLEPEITAQPRPLSDDVGTVADEDGLSIDADDLGSHFLSEAVEQGDHSPRSAADLELSLLTGAETDAAQSGPNFDSDNSLWEQTVGLAVQSAGGVDQLRASAAIGADELDAALEEYDDTDVAEAMSFTDSHIRELSLFDREAPEPGETLEPETQLEDGGHHARSTPRDALGEQVTGARAERVPRKPSGRIRKTAVSALRAARRIKKLAGKFASKAARK
jgi:hypothetical protein